MPSFKVSRSDVAKDSFKHYFVELVNKKNKRIDIPIVDVSNYQGITKWSLWFAFIECLLTSILVINLTLSTTYYWIEWIDYHFDNFYESHKLYFVDLVVRIIIPECVGCVMIIFLFFNQFANNSLKTIVAVSFSVCVPIFGSIAMIACASFHYSYETDANFPANIVHLKFICKLFDKNNKMFQDYYCPEYSSLYVAYILAIYSPICLIFVSMINSIVARNKSKSNITAAEMQLELLSMQRSNSMNLASDSLPVVRSSLQFGFLCTFYFIFRILGWFVFYLLYYAVDKASIGFFGCLLIFTSFFKFVFKYIAKNKHDIVTASLDKNNWYEFVSFEITIEFSLTAIYYWTYYNSFILELSQTNDVNKYISVVCIHMFSEIFQSTTRFSKLYFDSTNKFYLQLHEYNISYNSRILNMFLNFIQDESTFMEWKIRHSIDMSIRFLAFVCTTSTFLVEYCILDYEYFGIPNRSASYRALLYFFVTVSMDIVYFLLLFVIHLYFFNYNVWKPFLLMYSSDYRVFAIVVFVCACFFVVLFEVLN